MVIVVFWVQTSWIQLFFKSLFSLVACFRIFNPQYTWYEGCGAVSVCDFEVSCSFHTFEADIYTVGEKTPNSFLNGEHKCIFTNTFPPSLWLVGSKEDSIWCCGFALQCFHCGGVLGHFQCMVFSIRCRLPPLPKPHLPQQTLIGSNLGLAATNSVRQKAKISLLKPP